MGDTLQASRSHCDLFTGDRVQEDVNRSVKSTTKVQLEDGQRISQAALFFGYGFHVTASDSARSRRPKDRRAYYEGLQALLKSIFCK